jgi:hypothetical protein
MLQCSTSTHSEKNAEYQSSIAQMFLELVQINCKKNQGLEGVLIGGKRLKNTSS